AKAGADKGRGSDQGRRRLRRPAEARGAGRGDTAEQAVNSGIGTPSGCGHGIDQAESLTRRRRPRIRGASQLLMAAVAHGPIAGALAGAEPGLLRLLRLPLDRRKHRALVRAVAERLALRAPASPPP